MASRPAAAMAAHRCPNGMFVAFPSTRAAHAEALAALFVYASEMIAPRVLCAARPGTAAECGGRNEFGNGSHTYS